MILEQLSLIFTSYIYGLLILLPVLIIYWLVDYRSASISFVLRFHKHCLLASVYLPIIIYFSSLADFTTQNNDALELVNTVSIYQESAPELNIDQPPVAETAQISNNGKQTRLAKNSKASTVDYYPVMQDFVYYLCGLLIVFSFLGLMYFVCRYVMQSRYLRAIEVNGDLYFTANTIRLIRSSFINTSFSTGIFNKRIFIPSNISEARKNLIVKHELTHFSCRHHFWSLAETVMVHLFWYNPFVHLFKKRGELYRELECDSITIKGIDKFDYSRALVESAESLLSKKRNVLIVQNWVDKKNLKNRIDYILGDKRSSRRKFLSVVLVLGFVTSAFLFVKIGNINDDFLESELLKTIQQDHEKVLNAYDSIELSKVPESLIQALLIHEDKNFYRHNGLSYSGTVRAIAANLQSFLFETNMSYQGGSTITQQLAKSFLNEEKSFDRKIRELKVARVLEKNFSKNQILEMYLNRVYFGNRAWGVNQAANTYFDKPYTTLSQAESAMLIPFLAAPTKNNMIDNPNLAKQRQSQLLGQLLERMEEI